MNWHFVGVEPENPDTESVLFKFCGAGLSNGDGSGDSNKSWPDGAGDGRADVAGQYGNYGDGDGGGWGDGYGNGVGDSTRINIKA